MSSVTRRFEWKITDVTLEKLEYQALELSTGPIKIDIGDNKTEWEFNLNYRDHADDLGMPDLNGELSLWMVKGKVTKDNFHVAARATIGSQARHFIYKSADLLLGEESGHTNVISPRVLWQRFVKENVFSVFIEITLSKLKEREAVQVNLPKFAHYLNNPQFADFTLVSSDKVDFKVHRIILGEASPFFLALFTTDMQEKIKAKASFDDVDSDALREVLSFIYTGGVNITTHHEALNVVYAAEKFQLSGLKALCIEFFESELKEENVLDLLVIADAYNAKDFERKCMHMIMNNFKAIEGSEDWQGLDQGIYRKIIKALAEHISSLEVIDIETKL